MEKILRKILRGVIEGTKEERFRCAQELSKKLQFYGIEIKKSPTVSHKIKGIGILF